MNALKVFYYRSYQTVMRAASYLLHFPKPKLIHGENSSSQIGNICKEVKISRVLIVTGPHLAKSTLLDSMLKSLKDNEVEYEIFFNLISNPTIQNVEDGVEAYKKLKAQGIIAFGGGSPMDAAKIIGARIACPDKPVARMKGQLKIGRQIPFLIAVPTTAGTGSETTIAAVISDPAKHQKYAVNDPHLVPKVAVLDPLLIKDLPAKITAATGMDALTHAVEAYIGRSNTKKTKEAAEKAVKLIFENLEETVIHPDNMEARDNMLLASYYAGVAFTRAYVGYVHAIAHSLGAFYNVPHGYANAVILPLVLDAYGDKDANALAHLYDLTEKSTPILAEEEKWKAFNDKIRKMNKSLSIVSDFSEIILEEDIPALVNHAYKEGNPLYPVPKEFDKSDFEKIYRKLKEEK